MNLLLKRGKPTTPTWKPEPPVWKVNRQWLDHTDELTLNALLRAWWLLSEEERYIYSRLLYRFDSAEIAEEYGIEDVEMKWVGICGNPPTRTPVPRSATVLEMNQAIARKLLRTLQLEGFFTDEAIDKPYVDGVLSRLFWALADFANLNYLEPPASDSSWPKYSRERQNRAVAFLLCPPRSISLTI